ncbi:MAG: very short patch repair endonuclease [Chitinophagaceae bacterium]|nr:very short patch repair endonuclease [Chitinophagaceae bacterium]
MSTKDGIIKSMKSNRGKGTKVEQLVGTALFAKGVRYRKNSNKIFGKPDFSIKKYRVAIFVDGDFWHGNNWAEKKHEHKTNQEFWFNKIERNIERDKEVNAKLKETGWTVIRVWESEIKKDLNTVVNYIVGKVNEAKRKK